MSKIAKSFIILMVGVFAVSSCTDFVDPAIPYSDFETGVYLRTLKRNSITFNFFDLGNSAFSIDVEVVDEEGGKLVREVEVFVAHRRGPTVSNEVSLGIIPASAFGPNPNRDFPLAPDRNYPFTQIQFTAPETLQKLGMAQSAVEGGDFFEYRLLLRDTKGRTFTNSNLSGDIAGGPFYDSPFFYRVSVVCPSTLAGTYDLSTTGWCGNTYEGKVRFVSDGATSYIIQVDLDGEFKDDFSFGFYRACYSPTTAPPGGGNGLRLTDACGRIAYNSAGSSPWGDNFKVNAVTVNGPVLILDVESSYPPEQGVATITRTDGTNWPPLKL